MKIFADYDYSNVYLEDKISFPAREHKAHSDSHCYIHSDGSKSF